MAGHIETKESDRQHSTKFELSRRQLLKWSTTVAGGSALVAAGVPVVGNIGVGNKTLLMPLKTPGLTRQFGMPAWLTVARAAP